MVTEKTSLLPWFTDFPVKSGQKISAVLSGFPPARKYAVRIQVGYKNETMEEVASISGQDQEAIFCKAVVP